ncbi:MAG TPA: CBS domain-containing protein [Burkholderiales bacterium]|jgi:CBS domain-containing protein|nr:CBS domain-containing protein [Burkholderiales bacterium]
MKTVEQLLEGKPGGIIAIAPNASVLDALKLLAEKNVGAVLVMEGARLAGILSERDYARKVALKGKSSADTPVSEVMTRSVICVGLTHTNEDCMGLMTQKHIRHLPVVDGERVLGMLSIGDLVKDLISEQQFIISQLESYIHG